MAKGELEGPGSAERLERVRNGFRQTSRRWRRGARLKRWGALARTYVVWVAGLAVFAVATLALSDALR